MYIVWNVPRWKGKTISIYISLFFCIFIGFHRKFLGHVVTRKAIIRRASLFNEAFQSYKRSFFDWPLLYFISLGAKRENVSSKYDRVQETSHAKFIFHFFLFKKRHVAGIVQWTFRTEENRIFLFLSLFFSLSLCWLSSKLECKGPCRWPFAIRKILHEFTDIGRSLSTLHRFLSKWEKSCSLFFFISFFPFFFPQ